MIGDAFSKLFSFLVSLLAALVSWLKPFFTALFQGLMTFLKILFKPFLILVALIFYFLYQLGYVVLLLVQVFLKIGKLTISLVKGVFATLAGFRFTPSDPLSGSGSWSSIFANMSSGLAYFQLDVIAYVLLFIIWFGTAFTAFRILSSMRGGS